MKEHHTKAYIYVSDHHGIKYVVSTIEQIIYEDESINYIFTPHYTVIDFLDPSFFQGIPGLDLNLRKERYLRSDGVPTFIYERVPQKNREDLWDLLREVDLDYYNPLEWLIRTDKTYTGDSLSVGSYIEPSQKKSVHNIIHRKTKRRYSNGSFIICTWNSNIRKIVLTYTCKIFRVHQVDLRVAYIHQPGGVPVACCSVCY